MLILTFTWRGTYIRMYLCMYIRAPRASYKKNDSLDFFSFENQREKNSSKTRVFHEKNSHSIFFYLNKKQP